VTALDVGATDAPSAGFAARLAREMPTDPDLEIALDRKLERRADGPYVPVTREQLSASLVAMLDSTLDAPFAVSDERWLTGGASKLQLGFTLDWKDVDGRARTDSMILRMDPSEPINTTDKGREFEVVSALRDVLPVPRPYWVDTEARWFPEPALVYGIVPGVAKPVAAQSGRVVGLGTNFGPELRARLAPQFVEHLAALHRYDAADVELHHTARPEVGTTQNALWRLNYERRVWEEDRGEDCPLMELASSWLRAHLPTLDRVSVVHGDYRSGNFLFDEASATITGWLDWELTHLGDRHWDLAWCIQPLFGHLSEDGGTFLASGLLPVDELLERYEKASGLSVDVDRLAWFRVLICYSMMVKTIATTYRVARLGRSHQDILLARLEGSRSVIELELLRQLEGLV
jgi:aminoglycoside phosphotransferase (APT) family kinase protein